MHRYGLDHSLPEHIADGVMHAVGVVAAIAGATALMVWAALAVPVERIWPLIPYAAALVASFALSAAYNMTLHRRVRAVLRRFDHAAIYLLIAGTYTPFTLVTLRGGWGWVLFGLVWGLALLGVVLETFVKRSIQWLSITLYLGLGWLVLIAIKPLLAAVATGGLILLLAGGLCYSLGVIFYVWRRMAYHHAVWHLFVMAGSALHFFSIFFYVVPSAMG